MWMIWYWLLWTNVSVNSYAQSNMSNSSSVGLSGSAS